MTCQGSVLTLHGVTRAASGVYMCRAANGVGQPATDKVQNKSFLLELTEPNIPDPPARAVRAPRAGCAEDGGGRGRPEGGAQLPRARRARA